MKKFLSWFAWCVAAISLFPYMALAVNVTVPAASTSGYMLVSTTTGNYIATSTSPLYVSSIYATSTGSIINGLTISSISGSTQCLHVNSSGTVSGTGSDCGSGGGSGTVNTGTTGQFPYYAANGTTLTATSSIFLATTQNVGIGTTSPIANLSVQSTGGSAAASFINSGTGSNQFNIYPFTDGNTYLQHSGNVVFSPVGSVTPQLDITSTGNVGIGTSTPWGLLSVNANALSAGTPQFVVGSSTATNLVVANGGNVGIGTTNPTASLTVGTSLNSATGAESTTFASNDDNALGTTTGSDVAAGSISFNTGNTVSLGIHGYRASNGGTWTSTAIGLGMDVDSTTRAGANIWLNANGNVGIGTTSPSQALSVAGTGYFTSGLIDGNVLSASCLGTNAAGLIGTGTCGSGTVTSIGMTVPSFLSVTPASITTNGTFAISLSGTALPVANGGTGATTLSGVLQGNGTSAITAITGTAGQDIYFNGTNTALATSSIFVATNQNVGLSSTSPEYGLTASTQSSIFDPEYTPATSTSMTINGVNGNNQRVLLGTSNTTIGFSNMWPGFHLDLVVCNPGATAGTITWTGVYWPSGIAPAQTTTANYCDDWYFHATNATSTTGAVQIWGSQSPNYP